MLWMWLLLKPYIPTPIYRYFVFIIPKMLRRHFLYNRNLLPDLSRCAWESLNRFDHAVTREKNSVPRAVITIQTFGDVLGVNPHCHVLVKDSGFYAKTGLFQGSPSSGTEKARGHIPGSSGCSSPPEELSGKFLY